MTPSTAHTDLKYAAFVEHVKEVTLYGTADLDFWTKQSASEGLRPSINNGQAEVLIGATDLKWRGFRFREFTLSIGTQPDRATDPRSGFYLPQAFNSSRLFAFSERALFKTPYAFGAVTSYRSPPGGDGSERRSDGSIQRAHGRIDAVFAP